MLAWVWRAVYGRVFHHATLFESLDLRLLSHVGGFELHNLAFDRGLSFLKPVGVASLQLQSGDELLVPRLELSREIFVPHQRLRRLLDPPLQVTSGRKDRVAAPLEG